MNVRHDTIRLAAGALFLGLTGVALAAAPAFAQMTDTTQTPNAANEGIKKTLEQEIGLGRGTVSTPNTSLYVIHRDPFRAIKRGRQLFQRKFTMHQGFGPRTDDGVGDIENDASFGAGLVDSCAGCHARPRGAAGAGGNVFTRPDSRDAPHLFGLGLVEMLADEITGDLRSERGQALAAARTSGRPQTQSLTSKGISYGKITARPDGTFDTTGVQGVNPDLRVRPFFAQGKTISIREFLVGALNAEMGMQAVDPDLARAAAGEDVVTPSGMVLSGSRDAIDGPRARSEGDDPDHDGIVNEIPTSLVDYLEFYLLNYFKPALGQQSAATLAGRMVFNQIGCTDCHVQNLTINRDRRVADVETSFDAARGSFNRLFATAAPRFQSVVDDPTLPSLKTPSLQSFVVRDIFADFRRHDLGPAFHERNFDDGTMTTQFMTEPLWGVGTTAPYGHDGRSINLTEVILRHGGEALASRNRFAALADPARSSVLAFLNSLVLFPPDDTASSLNPADPTNPDFPQKGHGSISLGVLFNDPTDPE
jgi:di-heme oxidoreductase (putative peroxidase)